MQGEFSELSGVSGEGVLSREGNAKGRSVGEGGGGDQETGQGGAEDHTSDDYNALLKKRISSHPLYDKLVGIHLDCLKASGVGDLDTTFQTTTPQQHRREPDRSFPHHFSDLDQFMEAYCLALSKLREAMEEPQQGAASFVDDMHSRLEEIVESHVVEHPPQTSPSDLSGEASSKHHWLRS